MSDTLQTSAIKPDLMRPVKKHFKLVALFSAFYNILFLAPSLYMLQVYDRVLTTGGINTLLFLSLILVVSLGVLAVLDRIRNAILVRASIELDCKWAKPIIRSTMQHGASVETQNALRDFDQIRQTITGPSVTALCDGPWTPLYVFVCFVIHPILGSVALAGVTLLILLAYLNIVVSAKATKQALSDQTAHYNNQATLNGATDIINTLGMMEPLTRLRNEERIRFVDGQAKIGLSTGRITALTRFVRLVLQSTAIGLGGYLAVQGLISPGSIVAASIIMSRSLSPVEQLIQAWRPLTTASKSLTSVMKALEQSTQADRERMALPAPKGALAIKNLSYNIGDQAVINDISFQLEAGQILGIIGPSGAGKTTLARVLAGAISPTEGKISLDDVSFSDWGPERLSKHISYLPQATQLLPGTIADNIACFETKMEELDSDKIAQDVISASVLAGVDNMIRTSFPMGYDTPIGDDGITPSAGQSQRIGLARALYKKPAFMVLDEPNANLDADGEIILMNTLGTLAQKGQSIAIIAHRAGILKHCTHLLVLQNGKIEHFGTADDVRSKLNFGTRTPKPRLVRQGK